jgi:hypothetical protein
MNTLTRVIAAALVLALPASGSSMNELDYQGKILLNDIPYTGSGIFKFAISDVGNTTNYWANDGTGAGEPAGSITNSVWNGLFSVILGSAPMTPIDSSTFDSTNSRYLRVWFNSGAGFSEMLPSQKIVGGAYAMNAVLLGGQSAGSIQSNAVALATNAITLAGDVSGLPHANNIAPGVIVDADVNASAAIDGTKIVQGTTLVRGTVQLAAGATGATVIATGHPSLNAFSTVNSIVAGAPNSGFGIVGTNNVTVSVSGSNVVINSSYLSALDNVIWVATNGTAAGPGTIERPYDTPQAGYDAAAARYGSAQPSAVVIAGGNYSAGLTMSSGSVHVIGLYRPQITNLIVSAGPPVAVNGYQNVEGVVVTSGPMSLIAPGNRVRLHNCRFAGGVIINGDGIIYQDCRIVSSSGPAMAIATAPGTGAGFIGVYQSSIENRSAGAGAIEIGFPGMAAPTVQGIEVIGCEVVNTEGVTGPAIQDWTPFQFPAFPIKLYAHNYIKGPIPAPGPGYGPPAVADPGTIFPFPPGAGPFIGLYNNTIYGHVGSAPGAVAHPQWHGNNMVYGIITFPGPPSVVGWGQAGAGAGADPYGNIQHEVVYPVLPMMPDNWND